MATLFPSPTRSSVGNEVGLMPWSRIICSFISNGILDHASHHSGRNFDPVIKTAQLFLRVFNLLVDFDRIDMFVDYIIKCCIYGTAPMVVMIPAACSKLERDSLIHYTGAPIKPCSHHCSRKPRRLKLVH